jgi:type VI secretion system protein ImpI
MPLVLTIENVPNLPDGGPVSVTVRGERGIDIGRHTHLDWTLPDETRTISGKHCEVRWREGGYWLHDVSTNGTYLNGADKRMSAPHRLRDGDKLNIGCYIVAVAIDGPEAMSRPAFAAPRELAHDPTDPWSLQGEAAPPLDPRELRVAPSRPVGSDFLDWAADAPTVEPARRPLRAEPRQGAWMEDCAPAAAPSAGQVANRGDDPKQGARSWDEEWAPTPSPKPVEPPALRPQPRRAPVEVVWRDDKAASQSEQADAAPQSRDEQAKKPDTGGAIGAFVFGDASSNASVPRAPNVAASPVRLVEHGAPYSYEDGVSSADALQPVAADGASGHAFMRRMAHAAGLPEQTIAQRRWEDVADECGALLRAMTDDMMKLMAARFEARRIARSSNQTQIQALDNNPLKFSPTADDALRILFGPPTRSYMGAARAFAASFDDLKRHQMVTFRAMQEAMKMVVEDMSPEEIEASLGEEGRLAALMPGSKKARAWDVYAARWSAKALRQDDGMLGAFMLYFAQAYDQIDREV